MSAEVGTIEIKRFATMLENIASSGGGSLSSANANNFEELMVTAQSSDKTVLLIGRRSKGQVWKISIVETKEVDGWNPEVPR